MGDFLEIQCFDQSEELVLSVLNRIVDELVSEKDGIVGHFNLADSLSDTHFKLLLSLDSIANSASQFFEARWINEQKVALVASLVDLQGTFDIDLDDWDFA